MHPCGICGVAVCETLEPCPDCGGLFKVSKYDKCRDYFQGKDPKKQSGDLLGRVMDAVSEVTELVEGRLKQTPCEMDSLSDGMGPNRIVYIDRAARPASA